MIQKSSPPSINGLLIFDKRATFMPGRSLVVLRSLQR